MNNRMLIFSLVLLMGLLASLGWLIGDKATNLAMDYILGLVLGIIVSLPMALVLILISLRRK